MLSLKVEKRDTKADLDEMRKKGRIPAVFYGKKEPSTPISVSQTDFLKVWKSAGESSVVSLSTPEGDIESLIHDVSFDPVSGNPRHADFYVFEKGHKVKIDIPLEFIGVSPAVKDLGGILVKVLHAVKIEAMPKDLPHNIKVDVSSLKSFEDQIHAKDLSFPSGVVLIENEDEVVALVSAPREEKEEESLPIDLSKIEVEKKGKEEELETPEASLEK